MAKALELKTRNVSVVTEKMAGTESMAKRMSLDSTTSSTARSGVASRRPFSMTMKRCSR